MLMLSMKHNWFIWPIQRHRTEWLTLQRFKISYVLSEEGMPQGLMFNIYLKTGTPAVKVILIHSILNQCLIKWVLLSIKTRLIWCWWVSMKTVTKRYLWMSFSILFSPIMTPYQVLTSALAKVFSQVTRPSSSPTASREILKEHKKSVL